MKKTETIFSEDAPLIMLRSVEVFMFLSFISIILDISLEIGISFAYGAIICIFIILLMESLR